MSSEYGIYFIVFFSVLIFSAAASELVFRRREVGARLSEATTAAGEEFHLGDTTIADLGEAENRRSVAISRLPGVTRIRTPPRTA